MASILLAAALLMGCQPEPQVAASARSEEPAKTTIIPAAPPAAAKTVPADLALIFDDLDALSDNPDLRGVFPSCTPYRIRTYLQLAAKLQALDPDSRIKLLGRIAIAPRTQDHAVILCRMLFEAKPGATFRAPRIGSPCYFGFGGWARTEEEYEAWPLQPIALYESVPVLVTQGYFGVGHPEPAHAYYRYCLTYCQERSHRYQDIPETQLCDILDRFLKEYVGLEPYRALIMTQAMSP